MSGTMKMAASSCVWLRTSDSIPLYTFPDLVSIDHGQTSLPTVHGLDRDHLPNHLPVRRRPDGEAPRHRVSLDLLVRLDQRLLGRRPDSRQPAALGTPGRAREVAEDVLHVAVPVEHLHESGALEHGLLEQRVLLAAVRGYVVDDRGCSRALPCDGQLRWCCWDVLPMAVTSDLSPPTR